MTDARMTGAEVVAQANDDSFWNKDPLVVKAAVSGAVGSVLLALAAFGLVTEEQRIVIIEQVGNIAYGLFVIVPFFITMLTALWARVSVYAPRTAARIAIVNARSGSTVPTLLTPP